ncbi:MAG TPA: hypothetical protein VER35_03405 [Candidatus Limnocylindrales bacterium]|nr:hypothetical protein [Candidatus Limnocylindrales bacterium]
MATNQLSPRGRFPKVSDHPKTIGPHTYSAYSNPLAKKEQLLRLFMTQELIPALIRADTGYQLFTFPRFGVRELFLFGSVIEPIKHGIIYLI